MPRPKNRFYVIDRSHGQDLTLLRGPRWVVVDRETNQIVAEESTKYGAQQEAQMFNSGIYQP